MSTGSSPQASTSAGQTRPAPEDVTVGTPPFPDRPLLTTPPRLIDPEVAKLELAIHAAQMNACLNRVSVGVSKADVRVVSAPSGALVAAGDVFYDRLIFTTMLEGLTALAEAGAEVLIGDPYRLFLPQDCFKPLATFDIGVNMFLESDPVKATLVARLS